MALATVAAAACMGCGSRAAAAVEALPATATGDPTVAPVPADQPAIPFPTLTPYLIPGEQMAWEVSLRGITGGRARFIVGEPGTLDGRQVVIVRSNAHSAGVLATFKNVRDDVETTIDLATARPVHCIADFEIGERASMLELEFGDQAVAMTYRRADRPESRLRQPLPDGEHAWNTHAVIGALRAWQPAPGTRAFFYGMSGKRLYRVDITYRGTERIDSEMGELVARRYEGTAQRLTRGLDVDPGKKPRVFTIWVSDDHERLPLRVSARTEYGDIAAELVGYD